MIFNRIFGCLVESALRANAIKTIFENKTPSSQPAVSAMLYFGGLYSRNIGFSYLACLDSYMHDLKITPTVRDEEMQRVSHKE